MKKSLPIRAETKYDYAGKMREGRLAVGRKTNKSGEALKFGFIDEKGREVIPLSYDIVWDFQSGLARTGIIKEKENFWGIIDKDGNTILPNIYRMILPQDHKFFFVQSEEKDSEGKWSVFDAGSGEFLQAFIYDWLFPLREDMIVFRIGKKYGALHKSREERIPPVYERLKFFSQGLCAARKNGKWGYINKENKVIIPFDYDHIWPFENGVAQVYKGKEKLVLSLSDYLDKK